jgi:hypothetical protein
MKRSLIAAALFLSAVGSSGCDVQSNATFRPPSGFHKHADLVDAARRGAPRDCTKDFKFVAASQALGNAQEQIAKGDYRRANIRLRDGLEALGDTFREDNVLDDTGLHLSLAWSQDWNGELRPAAEERQRILTERLHHYAELEHLNKCPAPPEAVNLELPVPQPNG